MKREHAVAMVLTIVLLVTTLTGYMEMEGKSFMDYYDGYYGGMPFRAWPIEKQLEFITEVRQLIDDHDDQTALDFPDSIMEALNHEYGLPTESDLTQEQARIAAIEYLEQFNGESRSKLDEMTWTYSFLVDDRSNPTWLITIYDGIYIADYRIYQLMVPAQEGKISLLFDRKTEGLSPEEILNRFGATLPQNREEWTYLHKALYGDKVADLMRVYPGFNADQAHVVYGLPTENEVSYEDALAFAKGELSKVLRGEQQDEDKLYSLMNAEFVRVSHSKENLSTPYWSFVLGDNSNFYQIYVSAAVDGPKLLMVYSSEDSYG